MQLTFGKNCKHGEHAIRLWFAK